MVKLESVHGGHNSVAVGVRKGSYKEEVLADALARRVAELTGARYIPQDKGDVNQNLAYFVREMDKKRGVNLSIHFNAFNGSAHGTESFSYAGDSIGKSVSTNMSAKVSKVLGTFNRGNKNAPLYVIDWSQDVTTLLEVCFLDNDSDMKKFMAKREEVAHAIASCYDNYKGGNTVNKPKVKANYWNTAGRIELLKDTPTWNKDFTKKDQNWFFKKGSVIDTSGIVITSSGSTHARVGTNPNLMITLDKSYVKRF